jgi:ComF family protein
MWQYTGNVRHSLILYKFWRRRLYAGFYAKELAAHLQRWAECYDLIAWVPVSPIRKWSRGYDQVELIVRSMTAEVPVVPVLRKRRHNRRQAEIKGKPARLANVRGVYSCVDPERIRGKRVLLVDDIITTGATVSEAANTLRKAGAKEVFAACIAARNHYT